ncbi:hypothetical protein [Tessaracoccus caeni]|uniref:hypothetical protein n=1 Tax=Tessaracoccus caeni TaxID=3031239 RepID=UPI0023DB8FAE|nr:hypothetical protein [Tessaracoccus caeni]MDF1489203.1 hypothetical protein [Tessaracoccus caeni]
MLGEDESSVIVAAFSPISHEPFDLYTSWIVMLIGMQWNLSPSDAPGPLVVSGVGA